MRQRNNFIMLAVIVMVTAIYSFAYAADISLLKAKYPNVKAVFKTKDGSPSSLFDLNAASKGETPELKARNFMAENFDALGLGNMLASSLKYEKTTDYKYFKVVEFQQYVGSIPILGATAKVIIERDKIARFTHSLLGTEQNLDPSTKISSIDAVEAAFSLKNIPLPTSDDKNELAAKAQLLFDGFTPGTPLVYVVRADLRKMGPHNYYIFIDAKNGSVVRVYNRVVFDKMINTWPSNPGADGKNALMQKQIQRLEQSGDVNTLTGDWQRVFGCPYEYEKIPINYGQYSFNVPVCTEKQQAVEDANGDFYYNPYIENANGNSPFTPANSRDDIFAEAHLYYHLDSFYAWLQSVSALLNGSYGGINDPFKQFNEKPFRGTVNFKMPNITKLFNPTGGGEDLMPFDNAMYMPAGALFPGYERPEDSIVLGQGTNVDFSYDANIIYHELTHAMIDTVAKLAGEDFADYGISNDPGAMNEGYADFFASLFAETDKMGEYVGPRLGTGEGAMRNMTNEYKCPDYMWGEVHQDSMHFSGALWRMRDELMKLDGATKEKIAAAVMLGIAQLSQVPSFDEAGLFTVDAVDKIFGAAGKKAAQDALALHNVIGCERAIPMTGDPSKPKDMLFLPEKSTFGVDKAPGYLQLKIHVPAAHNQIVVAFYVQKASGSLGGATTLDVYASIKKDKIIQFSYGNGQSKPDGFKTGRFQKLSSSDKPGYDQYRLTIGQASGEEWPGEGDYYIAFLNATNGGDLLSQLGGGGSVMRNIIAITRYEAVATPDGDEELVDNDPEVLDNPVEEDVTETVEVVDNTEVTTPDGDEDAAEEAVEEPVEEPSEQTEIAETAEEVSDTTGDETTETEQTVKGSSSSGCNGGFGGAALMLAGLALAIRKLRK